MCFVLTFKGPLWRQEPETAGHRTSAGRKEEIEALCSILLFIQSKTLVNENDLAYL